MGFILLSLIAIIIAEAAGLDIAIGVDEQKGIAVLMIASAVIDMVKAFNK